MKKHKKQIVHKICNYLGQDLDHPMCKELMQHLEECPDCQFYLDTVKMTVSLCRETHKSEPVPEEVKEQIFKSLKIKKSE